MTNYFELCIDRYDGLEPEHYRKFSTWLDGPITLLAVVFTLFGTNQAFCFLKGAGLNRRMTASLIMLVIADLAVMGTVFFYYVLEATFKTMDANWHWQTHMPWMHGLVAVASTSSTWLVVYITVQRFLVVAYPLQYANSNRNCQFRPKSTSIGISLIPLNPTGNNSQKMLPCRQISQEIRQSSSKSHRLQSELRLYSVPMSVVVAAILFNLPVVPSTVRLNPNYTFYYRMLTMMVTQSVGPVVAIVTLTAFTEWNLYTAARLRKTMVMINRPSIVQMQELKERCSQFLAVAISVKFLLCRTLPTVVDIIEAIWGIDSFSVTVSYVVKISNFAIVANSATNSFVYFGGKRWMERKLSRLRARRTRICGQRRQILLLEKDDSSQSNIDEDTIGRFPCRVGSDLQTCTRYLTMQRSTSAIIGSFDPNAKSVHLNLDAC